MFRPPLRSACPIGGTGKNHHGYQANSLPCWGAQGAAIYLRETGEIIEMPAVSVGAVVNTVGAGDALFSAFLFYYAKGLAPLNALQRSQVFAAHKIIVSGASQGFVAEQVIEEWISC